MTDQSSSLSGARGAAVRAGVPGADSAIAERACAVGRATGSASESAPDSERRSENASEADPASKSECTEESKSVVGGVSRPEGTPCVGRVTFGRRR